MFCPICGLERDDCPFPRVVQAELPHGCLRKVRSDSIREIYVGPGVDALIGVIDQIRHIQNR